MHRRVFLIFGVAVFAAACTRAAAEPKILYEKKSPYTTIVVTEDEGHMRTLLFEKGVRPAERRQSGRPRPSRTALRAQHARRAGAVPKA